VLESEEGLRDAFVDIAELTAHCRFSDCRHEREPGCAVQQAVREGRLAPERLEAFHKLFQEAARPEYDTPLQTRGRQGTKRKGR
jgi:ribosome biogenesis GTPase / thiamine phosphate phosphatase